MSSGVKSVIKEADIKVSYNKWHKLSVKFFGAETTVYFDDKLALSAQETTFLGAGKVGFFTTADTLASFDDFAWAEKNSQPNKKN